MRRRWQAGLKLGLDRGASVGAGGVNLPFLPPPPPPPLPPVRRLGQTQCSSGLPSSISSHNDSVSRTRPHAQHRRLRAPEAPFFFSLSFPSFAWPPPPYFVAENSKRCASFVPTCATPGNPTRLRYPIFALVFFSLFPPLPSSFPSATNGHHGTVGNADWKKKEYRLAIDMARKKSRRDLPPFLFSSPLPPPLSGLEASPPSKDRQTGLGIRTLVVPRPKSLFPPSPLLLRTPS